jgi:hypothetical protein
MSKRCFAIAPNGAAAPDGPATTSSHPRLSRRASSISKDWFEYTAAASRSNLQNPCDEG